MRQLIILSGILEGIAGFLTFILVFGGLAFGFQWLLAKFAGIRFHGKYQAAQAYRENMLQENIAMELAHENPSLFKKALERCKNKKYALTHFNILAEAYKIEKEENSKSSGTYSKLIKDKLSKLILSAQKDDSSDTLGKLERLSELYNEGIITMEELTKIKQEILNNQI